ncbi:MAG: hypothetical protein AAGC55_13335 [Myxococcota bacterium]
MSTTLYLSKTAAFAATFAFTLCTGCVVGEVGSLDDVGVGDGDGTGNSNGTGNGNGNGNGNGTGNGNGNGTGAGDVGCATAPSYSVAIDQEAELLVDDEGDTYIEMYAELSDDPVNELEIALWDGAGIFEVADLGPGTYAIAGPETSYDDCGLCVAIYGDVDPVSDLPRHMLMAQSGTVQIDSIVGTLSGSVQNVVLAEVNPATSIPVAGGCTTTLPALSFNAPVVVGSTP